MSYIPGQPYDDSQMPPQGPPAPSRHRPRTRPAVAVAAVLATVGAGTIAGHILWPSSATRSAAAPLSNSSGSSGSSTSPLNPTGVNGSGSAPTGVNGSGTSSVAGQGSPTDVSSIASKVDPGLVDVNSTFSYQQASGAGTGIVLSSNGIVLTNNHVINGATSITVTDLGNGRSYPATVIGYDTTKDVAVLRLQGASGLQTGSIGTSSSARVGLPVVAIGNAGGVGGTPSAAGGSVTALDQSITASDSLDGVAEHLTGMIETNAAIEPGDSGGPLVDTSGQVIGMDTAAASGNQLQVAVSQGYAIPINEAMSIARSILAGDSSASIHVGPTAFLGVLISSSSESANPGAFVFGGSPLSQTPQAASGATVAGVIPGYAAANAGLGTGDVITAINGQAVSSPSVLSRDIASEKPGQSVSLTWTSPAGQTEAATVTLTAGPPA